MSDVVLAALIGAISSIIVNVITSNNQRKKRMVAEAVREANRENREANLENRLSSIEKKLDIHNGYAEKLGSISTDIAVIKNDIQNLYHKED